MGTTEKAAHHVNARSGGGEGVDVGGVSSGGRGVRGRVRTVGAWSRCGPLCGAG